MADANPAGDSVPDELPVFPAFADIALRCNTPLACGLFATNGTLIANFSSTAREVRLA